MRNIAKMYNISIEDDQVVSKDGDTVVKVETSPTADPTAEAPLPDAAAQATDPTTVEDPTATPTEPTLTDDDLEIKEDDSEEVSEEKEKKIKIEIEIAQEQIDSMSKVIGSLEAICVNMQESLQHGGMKAPARNIAKIAVSNLTEKFGIAVPVVSNENVGVPFTDFQATKVSVETISETITKIITWIRKKIKKILEFFSSSKQLAEKKLNKKIEKANVVKEKYKNVDDSGDSVKYKTINFFSKTDLMLLNYFTNGGIDKQKPIETDKLISIANGCVSIIKNKSLNDFIEKSDVEFDMKMVTFITGNYTNINNMFSDMEKIGNHIKKLWEENDVKDECHEHHHAIDKIERDIEQGKISDDECKNQIEYANNRLKELRYAYYLLMSLVNVPFEMIASEEIVEH